MAKETFQQAPESRLEGLDAKNGDLMSVESRSRVAEALQAPSVIKTQPKEVRTLIESLRLEEGYVDVIETQKFYQLLRAGEQTPDFSRVLKAFTPEMLALAERFQKPALVLETKGRSFCDLISAMNSHKSIHEQRDVYMDDVFRSHADTKPDHWGAYIIDSCVHSEAQDFDNPQRILKRRLESFAAYKQENGVGGMDRRKAAHLAMQRLRKVDLTDGDLWTILDEDPACFGPCVPRAGWSFGRRSEFFGWDQPYDTVSSARFRRSVGGPC